MALFKDVKKPVIRQAAGASADISPLRPKFVAKHPPCSAQCGAGVDVRAWVTVLARAEAEGRSPLEACEAAWRILADVQPFPATLGRICPHTCEQACHRASKDGAVAVNALERWLGDVALARGFALPVCAPSARVARVAIVGGGPAGLSCAYQLARRGHAVTVFEARDVPGGRLRDATRTGRLAAGIVDAEIARLLGLGIVLRCTTVIPQDLGDLGATHDFVFVATGRRTPRAGHGISERERADHGLVGGDAVRPGLVSAALASGRRAAEAIDAAHNGRTPDAPGQPLPAAAARVTLAWYPDAPRRQRTVSPDLADLAEADVVAEAKRCMSCGMCMDCERCWMYCTNNCFEKVARVAACAREHGAHEPYRVNVATCNGCRKCADECPCGYIDMV